MPIDQKSHLNEVEFNRPGFHEGKLVWAAAIFKDTLLRRQMKREAAKRSTQDIQPRVQV